MSSGLDIYLEPIYVVSVPLGSFLLVGIRVIEIIV